LVYSSAGELVLIEDSTAFYEKCGFKKKENEMAKYASESPTPGKL
jgi:hypothetical protein